MTQKLYGTYIEKSDVPCGEDMKFEYYLTEEFLCERYSQIRRYGVIIKKITGGKIEKKQINDVFYRLSDAEEFVYLLMRNKVTPMTLEEIITEYITGKISLCVQT